MGKKLYVGNLSYDVDSSGLEQMFASIDHGATLDNGVMVAGYVVMRSSMLFLWSQAARHDPERAAARRS